MGEPRETAAEFVRVARVGDLAPGRGMVVVAKGIRVALFRHEDGTLYALRNQCPHMGGELGEGVLNGDIVTCPWHGWQFDVKTGRNPAAALVAVRTFPVRVEGDEVYVGV
ncbi:MAG TPA: Rieske 2Fe-2S domain-containing protein [Candidatus Eisenbacteria bacterium]|jgi:nitrite reductase (NADH) small subunit/3-phenylpropionate/trans-cinnamate dioxygenase ferredoxin subunit